MKPLPEEIFIDRVSKAILTVRPNYAIPEFTFFVAGNQLRGLANHKEIKFNCGVADESERFVKTIVHEVVHYNGYMHHKETFFKELNVVYDAVIDSFRKGMI